MHALLIKKPLDDGKKPFYPSKNGKADPSRLYVFMLLTYTPQTIARGRKLILKTEIGAGRWKLPISPLWTNNEATSFSI
jgi:hypothetical protein